MQASEEERQGLLADGADQTKKKTRSGNGKGNGNGNGSGNEPSPPLRKGGLEQDAGIAVDSSTPTGDHGRVAQDQLPFHERKKRCIYFSMNWQGKKVINDIPFCLGTLSLFFPLVSIFLLASIMSFIAAVWLLTIPALTFHTPCLVSLILFVTAGFVGFCIKATNYSPLEEAIEDVDPSLAEDDRDSNTEAQKRQQSKIRRGQSSGAMRLVPRGWLSSAGTWFFLMTVVILCSVSSYILMWVGFRYFWGLLPGKIYVISVNALLGTAFLWPVAERVMNCLADRAWSKKDDETEEEEETEEYCREQCCCCCGCCYRYA